MNFNTTILNSLGKTYIDNKAFYEAVSTLENLKGKTLLIDNMNRLEAVGKFWHLWETLKGWLGGVNRTSPDYIMPRIMQLLAYGDNKGWIKTRAEIEKIHSATNSLLAQPAFATKQEHQQQVADMIEKLSQSLLPKATVTPHTTTIANTPDIPQKASNPASTSNISKEQRSVKATPQPPVKLWKVVAAVGAIALIALGAVGGLNAGWQPSVPANPQKPNNSSSSNNGTSSNNGSLPYNSLPTNSSQPTTQIRESYMCEPLELQQPISYGPNTSLTIREWASGGTSFPFEPLTNNSELIELPLCPVSSNFTVKPLVYDKPEIETSHKAADSQSSACEKANACALTIISKPQCILDETAVQPTCVPQPTCAPQPINVANDLAGESRSTYRNVSNAVVSLSAGKANESDWVKRWTPIKHEILAPKNTTNQTVSSCIEEPKLSTNNNVDICPEEVNGSKWVNSWSPIKLEMQSSKNASNQTRPLFVEEPTLNNNSDTEFCSARDDVSNVTLSSATFQTPISTKNEEWSSSIKYSLTGVISLLAIGALHRLYKWGKSYSSSPKLPPAQAPQARLGLPSIKDLIVKHNRTYLLDNLPSREDKHFDVYQKLYLTISQWIDELNKCPIEELKKQSIVQMTLNALLTSQLCSYDSQFSPENTEILNSYLPKFNDFAKAFNENIFENLKKSKLDPKPQSIPTHASASSSSPATATAKTPPVNLQAAPESLLAHPQPLLFSPTSLAQAALGAKTPPPLNSKPQNASPAKSRLTPSRVKPMSGRERKKRKNQGKQSKQAQHSPAQRPTVSAVGLNPKVVVEQPIKEDSNNIPHKIKETTKVGIQPLSLASPAIVPPTVDFSVSPSLSTSIQSPRSVVAMNASTASVASSSTLAELSLNSLETISTTTPQTENTQASSSLLLSSASISSSSSSSSSALTPSPLLQRPLSPPIEFDITNESLNSKKPIITPETGLTVEEWQAKWKKEKEDKQNNAINFLQRNRVNFDNSFIS